LNEIALEKLSEQLTEFGFTKEEAEVYVFLSSMGPSPARVISRRFTFNRMKAYRILKSLEEKGLVERIIGRPMKFVANPIQESLGRYLEGYRERLKELEIKQREVVEDWTQISKEMIAHDEESRFRIFEGRQQIYDLLVQMFERVRKEICIVTTKRDLHRLALMGIDDKLRTISIEGVSVRILTQVESPDIAALEYFRDFAEIRHIPLPTPIRFVTIDERETLTTTSMEDSMSLTTQEDAGLWTNASSYNSAMKIFFDALWRLATKASVIIEALQTGITPQEIRVIRSDSDFQESFINMISKCEKSIQIMASSLNDLPYSIENPNKILDEEINIQIMTHLNPDNSIDISELFKEAEVKHSFSPFDLQLLIIDKKEALMNIPSTQSQNKAVWSNLEPYVDSLIRIFDDYWSRGENADVITSRLAHQKEYLENINEISSMMEMKGWQIESPGRISGQSGLNHTFNLVASDPKSPDRRIAIDILLEKTAFNHIIRIGAKKMDIKNHILMLISQHPFKQQEKKLAQQYKIKLVYSNDSTKLTENILKQV
jgi:sugar-specific transcriptional regulator TrmB